MFSIGANIVLGLTFGIVIGLIQGVKKVIRLNKDLLEYKIMEESFKVQQDLLILKKEVEMARAETSLILQDVSYLRASAITVSLASVSKPKGANRNRRTEEQKLKASERRRAWWAAKKANDIKKKAQELNVPTPRLQGELEANVS